MSVTHNIQVERDHYFNSGYNHKARWLTYFYQIELLSKLHAKKVLEIGPGHGWVKRIAADLGIHIETVDIDPALQPDYVASLAELPLPDNSYDVVCAFEVLEHIPFDTFITNIQEMARVSKKYVVISVPDHRRILFHLRLKIPFLKYKEIFIKIPTSTEHIFDGQHYWEIGKKGYPVSAVTDAIRKAGLILENSVVYSDTPTNHFFVLRKA